MLNTGLALLLITGFFIVFQGNRVSYAQIIPTATFAQVNIPSVTPPPNVIESTPTFAIVGNTPTPEGRILMKPLSDINVRSSPEIADDNQLGIIREGDNYVVLGRYFSWIQFQYDLAPDGVGWVYGELVEIVGDESAILEVDVNVTPTLDPLIDAATQTREAVLDAPGGALTVTAESRFIQLPDGSLPVVPDDDGLLSTAKPTFTYPPGLAANVPTLEATRAIQVANSNRSSDSLVQGVTPIIPIMILGVLGILGLIISTMMR